ncbi:MAG: RNA polymerase sigma-54 factor, partial [Bacteroidaceae bacterium]|nr:RNA polymerase sigma-54 factor [Bacteroidaceae bacterium]
TTLLELQQQISRIYYTDFTNKHWDKLAKRLKISTEKLEGAIKEITKLDPRPGSALGESINGLFQQIIPDFIIENDEDNITCSLNNQQTPSLHISNEYLAMVQEQARHKKDRNAKNALLFLKQKIDAAQGFINAIEERQSTLLRTMQAIIKRQTAFFLEGDETLLRPMILKDIAEDTGLDISTISRVNNSKYAQTNFGIYPLKFFFSDGYTSNTGEERSTREIKKNLQELIAKEDKKAPLSDDELSIQLKKLGFPVARRTVAKYRQQLSIPVARLRK